MNEVFLFRLEIDGDPVYIWSGFGDLDVPADALSPATRYSGAGELLDLPSVQDAINGIAVKIDFTLSGVDAEIQSLAMSEDVKGAKVLIGTLPLDDQYQIAGDVFYEMEGVADIVSTSRSNNADYTSVRTITLSVLVGDGGRSRADLSFFTDADQRRRSPTDAFFSHVAQISAGVTRPFGPK